MAKKGSTAGKRSGRKRRGSGEDMTGGKAGRVEVRTAELDLAHIELNEKDIKTHFNAIKKATEQKDTYVSLLRSACKKANEVFPGLAEEIKFAMNQERKGDAKGLAQSLQLRGMVLKATGSTIQLEIFDTLAGDHMDQVYRRFYKDGKDGKPLDNQYPVGTDLAAQAARAWRHGASSNLNVSPVDSDKAVEGEEGEIPHNLPPPPDMSALQSETAH